jgi:hypothetical protein
LVVFDLGCVDSFVPRSEQGEGEQGDQLGYGIWVRYREEIGDEDDGQQNDEPKIASATTISIPSSSYTAKPTAL